ncbi:MAG TPA: sigma-70 family RNA polymerase sigma factor [Vicinamibacterales bacterium]|nr:sigma-70 family RNA polymerase sigma factor [Vicinamibacterales bacterium]
MAESTAGQPRVTMGPSKVQGREAEAALVERCRRGEMGAFEELYGAYAGRLYNVACRLLGNPADAEDLVQEAFLQAHRKLDTFRGNAALGTWLHRLLVNLGLDYLRSRAGRTAHATAGMEDVNVVPFTRPETVAERIDLEHAIARLPDGSRAAFVLHDVEGLDHKEVAAVLGVSEGTSKSQLHKARLKLREMLRQ